MSSDYKTVLITDDRIANLTDSISYAVVKGAQQITTAQFKVTTVCLFHRVQRRWKSGQQRPQQ